MDIGVRTHGGGNGAFPRRQIFLAAALGEPGHRHIDDLRIARGDGLIVEAKAMCTVAPQIVDNDVCADSQGSRFTLPRLTFQIDAQGALASAKMSLLYARYTVRSIDLDNLRPLVSKHHRCNTAGPDTAQVQNTNSAKRMWDRRHLQTPYDRLSISRGCCGEAI